MEIKQIEALIEELRRLAPKGEGFYPWEDVFASMMNSPEKVCLSSQTCPECGERLILLYFSSPDWTWQELCGRAGDMLICPQCHKQKDFFLRIMN